MDQNQIPENLTFLNFFFAKNIKDIFSKNGQCRWIGTKEEASELLNFVPFYSGKTSFFVSLYSYNFNKKLTKKLVTWDYYLIVFSALYFYLENNGLSTFSQWIKICRLFFSVELSSKILFFFEKQDFDVSSLDEKTQNITLLAVIYSLDIQLRFQKEESVFLSIKNILKFLKVSENKIDFLIDKAKNEKNLKVFSDFLEYYRPNSND